MKRTPLKRTAMRRKPRRVDPADADAYAEAHRRPGCQARIDGVCTGRNEHAHHRRLRSQCGPTTSEALLAVCLACHDHIHRHPAWSNERGFILRSGDPIEAWPA